MLRPEIVRERLKAWYDAMELSHRPSRLSGDHHVNVGAVR